MSDSFGANTDAAAADPWGTTDETPQAGQQEATPAAAELDQEALRKRARDQGWTETTAFDYDSYQRQGGDNRDWFGAGAVYEWSDEYGEVAPRFEELEKILFGRDTHIEEGEHSNVLKEIEVFVDGPQRIAPVTKVSPLSSPSCLTLPANLFASVHRRWHPSCCARERGPCWLHLSYSHPGLHDSRRDARLRCSWYVLPSQGRNGMSYHA